MWAATNNLFWMHEVMRDSIAVAAIMCIGVSLLQSERSDRRTSAIQLLLGPGKLDGHSDRKARVAVRFCIYWAGPPLLAGAAAVKRKTHRMYLHTPIEDHSVYN
jgi:hypothetical protein